MAHKYAGRLVRDILKEKKASVRQAPLPPGSPSWSELEAMYWEEVEDGARANKLGFKTVRKLLTDGRFDK
jgi:hypothetical protein